METTTKAQEIREGMDRFFGGTSRYHAYMMGFHLTDGAKYLADEAGCYWLYDIIVSVWHKRVDDCSLHIATLNVDLEERSAVFNLKHDDNVLYSQHIPFTDFPLEHIMLYVGPDRIICLPIED